MRIIPRFNDTTGKFEIVKVTKEAVVDDKGVTVEEPEFEAMHVFPLEADAAKGNEKACAAYDYYVRTGEVPVTTKKV